MTKKTQSELDFIQEAYIKPIRSVLIVDDQYPSWNDWLSGNVNGIESDKKNDGKWANFDDIKQLIDKIREMNPARIVDIEKGDTEDPNFTDYLHQSDLLILDYELDPENIKGEKFLKIARILLDESDHFNLILTHTRSKNLAEPFAQLLRSFLNLYGSFSMKFCDQGDEIFDKLEKEYDLENSIWHEQYADFRIDSKQALQKACNNEAPFNHFFTHCDSAQLKKCEKIALLMSLLKRYENNFKEEFREESKPDGLAWSVSEPFWIKTSRGFITFASKADSLDVISELKKAILNWDPTPSRLMSARLRAEIESQGVIFEDGFLSDDHVAWMFYQRMLKGDPQARETNLRKEIQRQMELYTDAVSGNLVDFGKKIVSSDASKNGNESRNSAKYKIDFSSNDYQNQALDNFNSFVSCKPTTGDHLIPGHIFTMNNNTVWVVLSPACDLVPDRDQSKKLFESDTNILPFTAVHLFEVDIERVREKATSSNYVFLRLDDCKLKAYSFYNSDDEEDVKAPQSKIFFAEDGGRFDHNGKLQLISLSRTSGKVEESNEEGQIHECQLRYEYALNLMAKLSAHSTRIGLEFEDPRFFSEE